MIGWAYYYLIKTQFLLLLSSPQSVERTLTQERPAKLSNRLSEGGGSSYKELLSFFRLAWRYQFLKPRCLPTALAQRALMAHYGFRNSVRIGVKKKNGQLHAHAWCEEFERNRYQPLEFFPS